jgi:hypothetical protein
MVVISGIVVEDEIFKKKFVCDLSKCKGACCTKPGAYGAPLEEKELELIMDYYHVVRKYLSPAHLGIIQVEGPFRGEPGNYATTVVNNRACVFVWYDEYDIARCAFETAFRNKEIPWQKPISCHLFPIRATDGVFRRLHYESIPECLPAVEKGQEDDMSLLSFLETPLKQTYGEEIYNEMIGCSQQLVEHSLRRFFER